VTGRPLLQPWQVWWVEFDPQIGHEQAGRRPAIVVGSALACSLPTGLALLVPCTTTDRKLAWHPPVTLDGRTGFAMCEQVKALSVQRLSTRHRAGMVPPAERAAITFVLGQLVLTSS